MPLLTIPVTIPAGNLPAQPELRAGRDIPLLPGLRGWWTTHEMMRFTDADGQPAIRALGPAGKLPPLKPGSTYPAGVMQFEQLTAPSEKAWRVSRAQAADGSNTHWMTTAQIGTGWTSVLAVMRASATAGGKEAWSIQITPSAMLFSSPHRVAGNGSLSTVVGSTTTHFDVARAADSSWWWEVVSFNVTTGAVKRSLNGGAAAVGSLAPLTGLAPVAGEVRFMAKAQTNPYSGHGADFAIFSLDLFGVASTLAWIDDYVARMYGV